MSGSGSRAVRSTLISLPGFLWRNFSPLGLAVFIVTAAIVVYGLIMVLSASSVTSFVAEGSFFSVFWKQLVFACIGVAALLLIARATPEMLMRFAWFVFAATMFLQFLVVATPLGVEVWGNKNWLVVGGVRLQPSEFLKLALAVWIGAMYQLRVRQRVFDRWQYQAMPVFLGAFAALGLVLWGHDLGTAMMLGAVLVGAMFFGGVDWKLLVGLGLVAVAGVAVMVASSSNRVARLFGFIGGDEDYSGLAWQPLHGLWALAAGGFAGVGLGESKAKWSWLPAADNDYIFAIIGEELGFVGAAVVLLLFLTLAFLLLRVIALTPSVFGKAVVGGILLWVVGQALVNIGVVIRVLPVFGVPLPLMSAGGTSLIASLMAMGVVIAVADDAWRRRSGGV